jgi:flagellin-specific chaperone FliS
MSDSQLSGTLADHAAVMRPAVAQKYLIEQLNTMSPVQLLVKVYDIAIEACHRQDRKRASKAIVELISALNFEYGEIANRFFHIYEYCMRQVKAGNFDEARQLLQELRDGWVEASRMNAPEAGPPPAAIPTFETQA